MDLRCVECNWLNKEVGSKFTCDNCGLDNILKSEEVVFEKEEDVQYNSKRRIK